MVKHYNRGNRTQPVWILFDGIAFLERQNGRPRYIFHSFKDVTRENKETSAFYKTVFDTNLIAMSFYDTEGHLIDFNRKMLELCEIKEGMESYFQHSNLFDDPYVKECISSESKRAYHGCHRMYYPALGIDKYVEMRIRPIFNDNGQKVYYAVTSIDITAERDLYLQQREHDRKIQAANQQIRQYDEQLRYLLLESKMFIWRFNFKEQVIRFSHTLQEDEHSETLEEYLSGMGEEHRSEAMTTLKEKLMQGEPFNVIHRFDHTPINANESWHSISGIPVKNADGTVEVLASNGDIGQGVRTTFPKIVAHELNIPLGKVYYSHPDTARVPDSGPTVASRSLMIVGELLRRAAIKLRDIWEEGKEQEVEEHYRQPDFMIPFYLDRFEGDAYPTYAWAVSAVEVEVDTYTGLINVLGAYGSFDVGTPVDYNIVVGQMEGGFLQGLGYASIEKMNYDEKGKIRNHSFTDYLVPTAVDVPNLVALLHVEEYPDGPYGAKGAGELPLVAPPPAYLEAVEMALGADRHQLSFIPFSPEDVIHELNKEEL